MKNIILIIALCLGVLCIQAQGNAQQNNPATRKLAAGSRIPAKPQQQVVYTGSTQSTAKKRSLTDVPPANNKVVPSGPNADTVTPLQKQKLAPGIK